MVHSKILMMISTLGNTQRMGTGKLFTNNSYQYRKTFHGKGKTIPIIDILGILVAKGGSYYEGFW